MILLLISHFYYFIVIFILQNQFTQIYFQSFKHIFLLTTLEGVSYPQWGLNMGRGKGEPSGQRMSSDVSVGCARLCGECVVVSLLFIFFFFYLLCHLICFFFLITIFLCVILFMIVQYIIMNKYLNVYQKVCIYTYQIENAYMCIVYIN